MTENEHDETFQTDSISEENPTFDSKIDRACPKIARLCDAMGKAREKVLFSVTSADGREIMTIERG